MYSFHRSPSESPPFYIFLSVLLFVGLGNGQNAPLRDCLDAVCAVRGACVTYPGDLLTFALWSKPYNLEFPVTPAAVIRPDDATGVSGAVKCAQKNGYKVQARSGGHSYGNYGLGGADGAVAIDLVKLKDFNMDTKTWHASIGPALRLVELDERLHANGGRAVTHGPCPGIGVGGHFTIGGLGPTSRMWGTSLDHVVEVEVVTADGTIQRASKTKNADLFWALRGAGASFGIVTEFVIRTHPEPGNVVEYTYNFDIGSQEDVGALYKTWQKLVEDPKLDRRFSSIFIVHPVGSVITGVFYGTEAEFRATGIQDRLPHGDISVTGFLGHLLRVAEEGACGLASLPTAFYTKSRAFRNEDLLDDAAVTDIFDYLDKAGSITSPFLIIFNTEGGAVNDTPANATAYPHRDKVMMYQSYGIGVGKVSKSTRDLIDGVHERILRAAPGARSTYAGYIDGYVGQRAAEELYWAGNLPELMEVKKTWDPKQVFRNPQSVEPAK
ncbi:hypothetical protein FZEAL_10466 [Fusarium zealandicum]|uniref:FAD-binding PCMH-type domain-containing protein n=1 Tax=Fusarium zealandicum TaxID=1053134 RepID=A0A8H4XAG0_9HYPO|nr:hypothetical protein FZEAL_10466 [Fusarium zealandicum]